MDNQNLDVIQSTEKRKSEFIAISFSLYFCYISYGLAYNIWGPTWVDLVSLLDSNQNDMAYGNSLMAIGYTVGAFSGGFIFNHLNRQLLVALYLILMAISTSMTPILKSYKLFLVFSVMFGLGEGGFDTACNAWILEMWHNENGPYMQALYFTFGLGSLMSPLISLKFLDDSNDSSDSSNLTMRYTLRNMTVNTPQFGSHHHNFIYSPKLLSQLNPKTNVSFNMNSNETTSGIDSSNLYIPYCITGLLLTISALIIIIMYFIKKYEPDLDSGNELRTNDDINPLMPSVLSVDTDSSEIINNNTDLKVLTDGTGSDERLHKNYIISMVFVGSLMLCFYEGMENINFEYLSTFNVNTELNLSDETSDLIVSAMSAAYTIGRGIGILVAIRVQPKYFLYFDLILISIGNSILYFFANTSEVMLIIGTVILGLGFSTVFPCIYSYMERQIRLTNIICGILAFSCALIATIDPIIVGRYIQDYPYILIYVNIGSTVLVIIAFITIEIMSNIQKNKQLAKKSGTFERTSI